MYKKLLVFFIVFISLNGNSNATELVDDQYKYVIARHGCAPWDGAALDILFYSSEQACSSTAKPSFEIQIWKYPVKSGDKIVLDDKEAAVGRTNAMDFTGRAMKGFGSPAWEEAKQATIEITKYSEDYLAGVINLQFKNHKESGKFIAKLCKEHELCG